MRRLLALAVLAIVSCVDPRPSIWFVPAVAPLAPSDADPLSIALAALDSLGYTILPPDLQRGVVATAWSYRDSLSGPLRSRVLVRVVPGPPAGYAVSVPLELGDGERFQLHGEDDEQRQLVIATLLDRMQAGIAPQR